MIRAAFEGVPVHVVVSAALVVVAAISGAIAGEHNPVGSPRWHVYRFALGAIFVAGAVLVVTAFVVLW